MPFLSLCWQWRQRRRKSYLSPTDGSKRKKVKGSLGIMADKKKDAPDYSTMQAPNEVCTSHYPQCIPLRASRCLPALLNSQFGRFLHN